MLRKVLLSLVAVLLLCLPAMAGATLEDLTVVNVGPVKATVFFRTNVPCMAKIIYHGEDNINYLAQEENAGLLHAVEVKNLDEARTYRFKVKLVDAEGKALGVYEKDEYAFITARHSLAMPANIYGVVSGAPGAMVIATFRGTATGEESHPLLSALDDQGRWTVNLGDAKGFDGMAMNIARGDLVSIKAIDPKGMVKGVEATVSKETIQKVQDLVF